MNDLLRVSWGVIIPQIQRPGIGNRLMVITMLVSVLIFTQPHLAVGAEINQPFVFEIKNLENSRISIYDIDEREVNEVIHKSPQISPPVVSYDARVEKLKTYLVSKKSPLASEAAELLKLQHYRLVLGISFAESNFCKHQIRPHNCWGIGGGKPETYQSYTHGVTRADQLIQKYQVSGLTTPKLMRNRWVGWQNDSWIRAVEQVTRELEAQGI